MITDTGVMKLIQQIPSLIRIDLQHTSISENIKKNIFEELSSRTISDCF